MIRKLTSKNDIFVDYKIHSLFLSIFLSIASRLCSRWRILW